ncbi:Uncharacterised protein [Peptostreptococcus anaerobius]|uniref:Uncharacterized protein n=1 Tax=Peptostreptococcus anaerobius TaxID=1261 RepID=A0A379CJ77_9FIRM|nr:MULTISPECIES: hypothetical protein [Peptostreptococcus]MDU5350524.1 hypothetical protein [Peptostreptococcus sp.]MDU5891990.1 hypothetical protein [Peptostreptococcus sp.]SFN17736.1 hypothetical protein SAMN05660467_01501 [Peptostreptococcus anaerobius]SUB62089.1 Uncharacterised protein [Peptostreptococcus anaerobius]
MREKLIDLRKNGDREIPKIDSIFPKDLIDNYPNEVVLLYSRGMENRQIGRTYFLLREVVEKNGIYATNDRTRLNSIKKYSQSLDFYKDGEFYFDRSNTTMLVSGSVIGKRFMGKTIFLDLDISVSQIGMLKSFISDLRIRGAIVSGICRVQVPDCSVV